MAWAAILTVLALIGPFFARSTMVTFLGRFLLPLGPRRIKEQVRFIGANLEFHANQPFNGLEMFNFFVVTEGHGNTRISGPSRTSDAVHIGVWKIWQVIIDDMRDLVDINAARGNVGGDEHLHLARLEALERERASILTFVAVDCPGLNANAVELLDNTVGAVLRSRKDERSIHVVVSKDAFEECGLVLPHDEVDRLHDGFSWRCNRRRLHEHRVSKQRVGEITNFFGHGGREE